MRWLLRRIVLLARLWQRSLKVRVVSSTMVLGLAATSLIGVVLAEQVAGRLLDSRRQQAFRDAGRATSEFRNEMATYNETTGGDLKSYVRESLDTLRTTGGDSAVGVLLLRQAGQPPSGANYSYGTTSASYVSTELRDQVVTNSELQSQSIQLTGASGRSEPGLIVGGQVQLPVSAGDYELYFVITLGPEQRTLASIQRVLSIGMFFIVILLGAIAWLVSRQVVDPVQEAARVARRISRGNLDERMNPRGRDELATLAGSFNDMADSLQDQIEAMEELSRLQRRFVSDVSHELRTPLTTIRMAAEVIDSQREEFDAALARSSELLTTQLDRFEALLSDLLEISRFDAGAAALEAEDADLGAIARRVVDLAAPLAVAKSTELVLHLQGEPATAEVDSRRVERIVRNLVVNAIEHAEEHPVQVYVAADDRTAAVLVVDHGVGLRPGDAERVFDRFWRADPARARTTGGTGLGLAISLEDALLHGGSLRAWGTPGEGSRFLLVLPRHAGTVPGRSPLPLAPSDHVGADSDEEGQAEERWLIAELNLEPVAEDEPPAPAPKAR